MLVDFSKLVRRARTAALLLCALSFSGVVEAQTATLRLGTDRPVIAPGDDVFIDVYVDNPGQSNLPLGGYQVAVRYPTDNTTLINAPLPLADSILQQNFAFSAAVPVGTGFPSCPGWDDGLGTDIVTALGVMPTGQPFVGATGHLCRIGFATSAVAGDTDTFEINNFEDFCAIWPSSVVVDPSGSIVPTQRQGVSVSVSALPPVTGLTCTTTGTSLEVSWDDSMPYDSVRVYRDGVLVSTHIPIETMYTDLNVLRGVTYTYAVVGVIGGAEAPYEICTLTMPFNVPTPELLTCSLTAAPGSVSLTWQNPQAYSSVEVSRDGTLLATLSGVTQSYLDTTAGTVGTATYMVVGFNATNPSMAAECSLALDAQAFIRGDSNSDGAINISDVTSALNHIFGISSQSCPDAMDFDDSGTLDVTDPVTLAQYLFVQGMPPAPPFPNPGLDPTPDGLDCMPAP
ncbi:MAG: dockerin type I repeat-containing protein [Planctomycetota bacterium]